LPLVDNQFWKQADFVKSSFFLVPWLWLGRHFTLALPPVFFAREAEPLALGSQPEAGNQLINFPSSLFLLA
jgi:hypothetical protein